MTVSTEISSNEYTGNGVTTDFDYKFRIFKANQLSVITSDADGDNVVTLRLGTDYTVTGANKSAGGKVILTKPLANGHKISIARDIPITQETSFRNQSKFFAETHENAFDYLTMILQSIWGSLGSLYLKRPNILANWFDAKGYRIANLGKPKRDGDAVDLGTLKDEIEGINSTILKKEKRTLRVDDIDIAALPKANDRAGKVLTFDKDGKPIAAAPASGSAIDVMNILGGSSGAGLIGTNSGVSVQERLDLLPNEADAAGTAQRLINEHNSNPSAHPELSRFITQEADRSESAAIKSENAMNSAMISGGLYKTEEEGRQAVADGINFRVQGADKVAVYEYRRISATQSELLAIYPSKHYIDEIAESLAYPLNLLTTNEVPIIMDSEENVILSSDNKGKLKATGGLYSSEIDIGDGNSIADNPFSNLMYALVDKSERLAFGIDESGEIIVSALKSQSVNVDDTSIYNDPFSNLAYAIVDGEDNVIYGVTIDGEVVGATSAAINKDPTSRDPETSNNHAVSLNHFIMNGQSLSVRAGTALPLQDSNDKTFSGGLFLKQDQLNNTLVQAKYDNTSAVIWNAMQQMKFLMSGGMDYSKDPTYHDDYQTLASSHGNSGARIESLRKGGSTGAYEGAIHAVSEGHRLAELANESYSVQAFNWIQGEANRDDTADAYITKFNSMMSDYKTDIDAITKQGYQFPILVYQPSGNQYYAPVGSESPNTIADAFYRLAEIDSNITVTTPTYWIEHADALHPTNKGSLQFGMQWGKVLYKKVYRGENWRPLEPISIEQLGTKTVIARFHVPEPPLVFDETLVTNPGNYGFDLRDDLGVLQITSIKLLNNNSVELRVNRELAPNVFLSYAYYGVGGNGGGPLTGARGNMRDSDQTVGLDNTIKLYNWALAFNKKLPYTNPKEVK